MDAFATTYPNCTELNNFLTISGDDIVDLTPLSGITSVYSLSIRDNALLENLDGLNSITDIDGYDQGSFEFLLIWNNANLVDISALINMSNTGLFEGVIVRNNPLLESLIGLQGLNNFVFTVDIDNNDSLIDLDGLNNVITTDNFDVKNNDNLINLFGLDSFNSSILIENNISLQNLNGLTNSFNGGAIGLINNDNLQSLDGIEAVSSIQFIVLDGNDSLTDISAITLTPNLPEISFTIKNNTNLSNCNIETICSAIGLCNTGNYECQFVIIENNAENCNSIAQVSNACGLIPSNDNCEGAINLTIGETTEAYNDMATASPQTPNCNDTNRIDVWFTFNSGDLTAATIDVDADYSLQLWEGTCSSLTQVTNACASSSLTDIPVATNTDYYLQVWSDGTGRRATGLFNVVVQDATLSVVEYAFEGFSIYPNPVNNVLNLKAAQNIDALVIYNLLGQNVLASKPNESQIQMDMSSLSTGLYVLKVNIGNQTETYKIVKE